MVIFILLYIRSVITKLYFESIVQQGGFFTQQMYVGDCKWEGSCVIYISLKLVPWTPIANKSS